LFLPGRCGLPLTIVWDAGADGEPGIALGVSSKALNENPAVQLTIDLCHDLDLAVAGELQTWGHVPSDKENPLDRYCLWFEMREREIPPGRYQVLRSRELQSSNDAQRLAPVLHEIEGAFRGGKLVAPYLSARTAKLGKAGRDYMLLHWGIRHLHLSPISTKKPSGLVARADDLLFFRIEGSVAYFVGILPHADPSAFERKSLLETVERNWPHLHHRLRTGYVERELSPSERKALRRGHLIHMEEVDGKLIMPTFGVTSAGSPADATRTFDRQQLQLREIEQLLRDEPASVFPEIVELEVAHVRLKGMWEHGFDLIEMSTGLARRVQIQ
jgi:hypothetical protein